MERHGIRIVLGESPGTMRKLCLSINFKLGEVTVFYIVILVDVLKEEGA